MMLPAGCRDVACSLAVLTLPLLPISSHRSFIQLDCINKHQTAVFWQQGTTIMFVVLPTSVSAPLKLSGRL